MGAQVNINHLPQLRGENYVAWKYRVRAILEEKQTLHILDKKHDDIRAIADLVRCNAIAKSTIIQCITDKHLHHIQDAQTAKEMFEKFDT